MLLSVVLTDRISWIANVLAGREQCYAEKVVVGFNSLKQSKTQILTVYINLCKVYYLPGLDVLRGSRLLGCVAQITEL